MKNKFLQLPNLFAPFGKSCLASRGQGKLRIPYLTVMLSEFCNLDCWMCDFRKSSNLAHAIPYNTKELVAMLNHPVFEDLSVLTLTGGEPFAFPTITELFAALLKAKPGVRVNFSSNATLLGPMIRTLNLVGDMRKTGLLVSVDGIEKHDIQRGREGAFELVLNNLDQIRTSFPDLDIIVKFTVTPINFDEIFKTYEFFAAKGIAFTVKMVENNQNYTNKLSYENQLLNFQFTGDQLLSIRAQFDAIVEKYGKVNKNPRFHEIRELVASFAPGWKRTTPCQTPTNSAFIDSHLNLFSCKEYPALLNLGEKSLDELSASLPYREVIANEQGNAEKCTFCTSQMRRKKRSMPWPF